MNNATVTVELDAEARELARNLAGAIRAAAVTAEAAAAMMRGMAPVIAAAVATNQVTLEGGRITTTEARP